MCLPQVRVICRVEGAWYLGEAGGRRGLLPAQAIQVTTLSCRQPMGTLTIEGGNYDIEAVRFND